MFGNEVSSEVHGLKENEIKWEIGQEPVQFLPITLFVRLVKCAGYGLFCSEVKVKGKGSTY
jgi:hypothetical protein